MWQSPEIASPTGRWPLSGSSSAGRPDGTPWKTWCPGRPGEAGRHPAFSRGPARRHLGCPAVYLLAALTWLLFASVCPAQGIFGKNKVQYSELEWLEVEGQYVTLYFYAEEEEIASRAFFAAESTCAMLSDTLRHELSRRIPLALFSSHRDFQQSNIVPYLLPEEVGGLTEFAKGRVLVPYTGSFHRFSWVLTHELTHAFMLDKIEATLRRKRKPLGFYPPLWFSEGLAEYMSARHSPGLEAPLRDAVLSDQLVGISEMWKISGSILVYREGHSLVSYIAERFGFSFVVDILEGWGDERTFEALLEKTLNVSTRELSRDWTLSVKETYYPDVAEREWIPALFEHSAERERLNLSPLWVKLKDGREMIVYLSTNGQSSELRAREMGEGGRDRLLLRGGGSKEYESLHLFRSRISVNRSGLLAFSARKGERDVVHLYDLNAGERKATVELLGLVSLSSPALSPDGSRLVVSGQDASGRSDLFVVVLADSSLLRLTNDFYDERDPDWSPDGDCIVFSSDRCAGGEEGRYKLFVISPEEGQVAALTPGEPHDNASETTPRWSPCGKYVAYVSDSRGVPDVHVLDLQKRSEARLTRSMAGVLTPSWDDGGKHVVLTGLKSGRYLVSRTEVPYDSLRWERLDVPLRPEEPAWKLDVASVSATPYRRKLGLDIVRSTVGYDPEFSAIGSGQLALSDVLGNEHLLFYLSSQSEYGGSLFGSLSAGATYLNLSKRISYGIGLFSLGVLYDEELAVLRQERRSGMLLLVSYPRSRFERVEATMVGRLAHNHLYRDGTQARVFLLSNYLSYVWDNSVFHGEGELVGTRANLTVGFTRDVTKGMADYVSILADVRENVELSRRTVLASRVVLRSSFGAEGRRFYMGGPWSLRGYGTRSLSGRRLVLVNNELRLPILARIVLRLPGGALPLPRISGALFADAGSVGEAGLDSWKGSFGAGFYIGGGYFPIVRLNTVWRTDFSSVDEKPVYEFFVGWNY
ncbi:MAG: PD40 domain-containing protein [Candidatus Eiseniibacteriota bacterium]|nr:MAG: PD40 domain-containing protein [Candidatus Eisenbacteria bacterium]